MDAKEFIAFRIEFHKKRSKVLTERGDQLSACFENTMWQELDFILYNLNSIEAAEKRGEKVELIMPENGGL